MRSTEFNVNESTVYIVLSRDTHTVRFCVDRLVNCDQNLPGAHPVCFSESKGLVPINSTFTVTSQNVSTGNN